MDFTSDIGYPGQFPYLRANQVTGYRGKYWTFRMFSGMGSAEDTNRRWHMLLQSGNAGLSTAFDFPTLMGYDTDSPKARGECGKIDEMGGMVVAIEKGFPQLEISDAAYKFQRQINAGEKIMIGVNKYYSQEKIDIPFMEIDERVEAEQIERLNSVRRTRDNRQVRQCLEDLAQACKRGENVMPYCIEAVKAYSSIQEICDVYREVFGEFRDPGIY